MIQLGPSAHILKWHHVKWRCLSTKLTVDIVICICIYMKICFYINPTSGHKQAQGMFEPVASSCWLHVFVETVISMRVLTVEKNSVFQGLAYIIHCKSHGHISFWSTENFSVEMNSSAVATVDCSNNKIITYYGYFTSNRTKCKRR